jgi:LysR family transcriptional regulator (chromosome initiation inhibitor)
MLDYAQLEALLAVIRERSFDGAARALGLTPSAISQRIKRLEERVGAIVVTRTSPTTPTEIGLKLCRHTERVRLMETDVLSGPMPAGCAPQIKVKIAVGDATHCSLLISALVDATGTEGGDILLDIATFEPADVLDVIRSGGALAAMTDSRAMVNGFKSVFLGFEKLRAVASRQFMARHFADGLTVEALAAAPMIWRVGNGGAEALWLERVVGTPSDPLYHLIPSAPNCIEAIRSGIAWGMCEATAVDPLIARGELVELAAGSAIVREVHWNFSLLVENAMRGFH